MQEHLEAVVSKGMQAVGVSSPSTDGCRNGLFCKRQVPPGNNDGLICVGWRLAFIVQVREHYRVAINEVMTGYSAPRPLLDDL
jgi:hypothetical protein